MRAPLQLPRVDLSQRGFLAVDGPLQGHRLQAFWQWAPWLWLLGSRAQAHWWWCVGLLAPGHVGTHVPCIGRRIPHRCATRDAPLQPFCFSGCLYGRWGVEWIADTQIMARQTQPSLQFNVCFIYLHIFLLLHSFEFFSQKSFLNWV